MTELRAGRDPVDPDADEISMLAIGSVMLRWRRTIIALGLIGGVVGVVSGLTSKRVYVAAATFIPQGSETVPSGLALAASQFGLRVPTSGGAWQPAVYVELLRSHALLRRVALDTVTVEEQGGRRIGVMDLLEIEAPTEPRRIDFAVRALRTIVKASEDKRLSAVKLTVTTEWPSVSFALAQLLVGGVNQFNLETRKSRGIRSIKRKYKY